MVEWCTREFALQDIRAHRHQKQNTTHAQWESPRQSLFSPSFLTCEVSWSEVATVPKRKSHRGLDLDLSLNSEEDIWKGRKESNGTK